MKLGHIVQYHNVFFKFDTGSYRIMPSRLIALCSLKYVIFDFVEYVNIATAGESFLAIVFFVVLFQIQWIYCPL